MPRIDRKTVRFSRKTDVAPGFSQRIPVDDEPRCRCQGFRYTPAGDIAGDGDQQTGQRDPDRLQAGAGEQSTGQRADEDGDEGPGLDQRVAADKFIFAQVLRQDRVLYRPEQCRLQAEQEQGAKSRTRLCRKNPTAATP